MNRILFVIWGLDEWPSIRIVQLRIPGTSLGWGAVVPAGAGDGAATTGVAITEPSAAAAALIFSHPYKLPTLHALLRCSVRRCCCS